ncbi:hypothetical protein Oweho_0612 [Owenweeksia hongkongensis DSM 17368]|uniref:DUF4835 domain-containing protein n=1 Tax=Owenweeksia hongkongensis (strain DSM 17368 / CIP 108786 / JCM 12287 / NRRL B-23963 / UST20020801) TaxID=926562 RepID=G8R0G7_OWEHD|nr:DUF4835 family protein [Owenweeksia hongkongensis]AEV31627.1 hypothetical protein Oweho_0612 [Owenweeksia hongkongensis DSM 17368]
MQKIFYYILLITFCLSSSNALAQELNAQVQIISDKIQATNRQRFTTLETAIREFLNNRQWTNEKYAQEEKISCQFILTLNSENNDAYSGDIQILYSRPIYKSGYNSPVLIHRDTKFDFTYLQYDRLDFSINTNLSNLTSVLAYYAYIIIGLDHDTYSIKGGDPYYTKAQTIVNNAQGSSYGGWSSFEGNNNRFWLVDNLTSPVFDDFRIGLYQYHRLGLDLMNEPTQQAAAKNVIKNSLMKLEAVNNKRRNSMLMQIFFDAKSQEIINIFSGGEPMKLADLKEVLVEIDPTNSSKYQAMGKT